MNAKKKTYSWGKQKDSKFVNMIDCPEHDTYKDFKRDPTGFYVLIRVDFEYYRIEAAICDSKHKILKKFSGRGAAGVYHEIFRYEKKYRKNWFKEKTHIAYLGKELKKAEIALVTGNNGYFQE